MSPAIPEPDKAWLAATLSTATVAAALIRAREIDCPPDDWRRRNCLACGNGHHPGSEDARFCPECGQPVSYADRGHHHPPPPPQEDGWLAEGLALLAPLGETATRGQLWDTVLAPLLAGIMASSTRSVILRQMDAMEGNASPDNDDGPVPGTYRPRCQHCGDSIPSTAHPAARYCRPAHRSAAYKARRRQAALQ